MMFLLLAQMEVWKFADCTGGHTMEKRLNILLQKFTDNLKLNSKMVWSVLYLLMINNIRLNELDGLVCEKYEDLI